MVAGIDSWTIGCGLPKIPVVFTRISFFTEWIWTKIGKNKSKLNIAMCSGVIRTLQRGPQTDL